MVLTPHPPTVQLQTDRRDSDGLTRDSRVPSTAFLGILRTTNMNPNACRLVGYHSTPSVTRETVSPPQAHRMQEPGGI